MGGQRTGVAVTIAAVSFAYVVVMVVMFRYAMARTPAGIVRRLARTGRPVTLTVDVRHPSAWDPTLPLGRSGFFAPGTVTYTLDDPKTVHVRFLPRSGTAVERSAEIPAWMLPDTPETRRRRRIARIVIAVYVLIGAAAFGVTTALVDGAASLRIRAGGVAALVAVAVAWLATHVILTRPRRPSPRTHQGSEQSTPLPSRHLLAWAVGAVIVAAALGVAWHLGNSKGQPQMSWASSFLSAGVFVLVGLAIITASAHHHTYIHHADQPRTDRRASATTRPPGGSRAQG